MARTVGAERVLFTYTKHFCNYNNDVKVSFDPAKRIATLLHRALDFADAEEVFSARHATLRDDRQDYGEARFNTADYLAGRLVVVVWTPRDGPRRIISMRYAHEREAKRWRRFMEGPG